MAELKGQTIGMTHLTWQKIVSLAQLACCRQLCADEDAAAVAPDKHWQPDDSRPDALAGGRQRILHITHVLTNFHQPHMT